MEKHIKRSVAVALSIGILTSGFIAGVEINGGAPNLIQNYKINQLNDKMDIDDSYYLKTLNYVQNYYVKNIDKSKPVEIKVSNQYKDFEIAVIKDIIYDLNLIFEKMNSGIVFKLSKTNGCSHLDAITTDTNSIYLYKTQMEYGISGLSYLAHNSIEISNDYDVHHKYSRAAITLMHELGHHFGLDEAYKDDSNHTFSIMHEVLDNYNQGFTALTILKCLPVYTAT